MRPHEGSQGAATEEYAGEKHISILVSNLLSIEQLLPDGGVPNCHFECPRFRYLAQHGSEDLDPRTAFADDIASRDTEPPVHFSNNEITYDSKIDPIASGRFSHVFKGSVENQRHSRVAALKVSDSRYRSVYTMSV